MKTHKVLWIVILGLLGTAAVLSGCAPIAAPAASEPVAMVDIQAEIEEAVKATVIAMSVEDQMAEQMAENEAEEQQEDPTPTPTSTQPPPTATPFPTATAAPVEPTSPPEPTATLIAEFSDSSNVLISAEVNTNCRLGPSKAYRVDGYLMTNAESTVHGQDKGENWWYIANPTKDGEYCWVWRETTDVQGNADNMPVVTPPPLPKRNKYDYLYDGCGYYGCPIRVKYDGWYDYGRWNNKWYDIRPYGCEKWKVCKYTYGCDINWKKFDDGYKIKIKAVKVCKRYVYSPTCTIKQINKGKCEPVCAKW